MPETLNSLTHGGTVATDPEFIFTFRGERYGSHTPHHAPDLALVLARQNSVTLRELPDWIDRHADEIVRIEIPATDWEKEVPLGVLADDG